MLVFILINLPLKATRLCWFTSVETCPSVLWNKTDSAFFLLCLFLSPAPISQTHAPPAHSHHHHHHLCRPRRVPPRGEAGSTRAPGRHWGEGWEPPLCRGGDPLKLHAWLVLCSPLNAPARSLCAAAGPRCEEGGSEGRAMPGQSMTSLAAASPRRARRYVTLSPQLGQTEPNRLLVVFPLFTRKKKAWEKSRDPRPSLRTAEYCLHGNEGNKTTELTGLSDPRKPGGTKAGCVIGMSGQGQRGAVRRHPAVPHRARELLLRGTRGSFWESQRARAHPSFLFLKVMSLPLLWGACVNIVAQQPVLFQKRYCNTECAFVVPVFCSTHKSKMGTHAQLVLVFASCWFYLKRKW